jgi:lipoyl(octanoyl) transferase
MQNNHATQMTQLPKICWYGLVDYVVMHNKMKNFIATRNDQTLDEIWFVQHTPVFTLGRNESRQNILTESSIPIVQSDRGGDVTYHGPGQLIAYCLFDIKRIGIGIKALVQGLEQIVIEYLARLDVPAHRIEGAPGVYVDHKKIASLGLRVRNGYTFHGIAINVNMDLRPFTYINPCGLQNMQMTQIQDLGIPSSCEQLANEFSEMIIQQFYVNHEY